MGEPLTESGRKQLAHSIFQGMIFEWGIFIGRNGGDLDDVWRPEEDDVSLLWNLLRTTPGLDSEMGRVYGMSWFRLKKTCLTIDEAKFKKSPWYVKLIKEGEASK